MQKILKKLPLAVFLSLSLSACITINAPSGGNTSGNTPVVSGNTVGYRLASTHWADVSKISQEAQRLNDEVRQGKITKVQAAQYLNRYRLNLVGSNQIDDNMYEVYQKAALDSQRGVISPEQSKQVIVNALKGWQQRWHGMSNKPANPAFTNFLLSEVMQMEPLK